MDANFAANLFYESGGKVKFNLLYKHALGVAILAGLFGLLACAPSVPKTDAIFLVRHAEKTAEADDPGLTDAGKARALALANRLGGEGITHIHSSDYVRTRDTAEPLAVKMGIEIEIYDPRDLPSLAKKLKMTPGRHLVVGHSNTTPPLVELLGGEGGTPIVEASEYDRLYIVTTKAGQPVKSYLTRYGAPYVAKAEP